MNSKMMFRMTLVCMLVMVVAFSGCKKKKPTVVEPVLNGSTTAEQTTTTGLPEVDQDSLLWNEATGLQKVYFDFDSNALRPDAIDILNKNGDKIKQVPNVKIQIEGHCDERGTQEYNLALGERRALAVRDYLVKVGVSGDRLLTISFGEEKPAVEGHDESAWGQNRRASFNKGM
jgi:peptidoglycan-associated lipoprotein